MSGVAGSSAWKEGFDTSESTTTDSTTTDSSAKSTSDDSNQVQESAEIIGITETSSRKQFQFLIVTY